MLHPQLGRRVCREGNKELNNVRKVKSDVQCNLRLLPKDQDGTSAMAFCFPSMCSHGQLGMALAFPPLDVGGGDFAMVLEVT